MPLIPEIKFDDITISDKYTQGYNESRCVNSLWQIYNLIKNNAPELGCLKSIGILGDFENVDARTLTVDYQKKNVKVRAWFSKPAHLFCLEKMGFSIYDIKLLDDKKAKSKLTKKDIIQFRISYPKSDDLILGLKLFAEVCGKMSGDPFDVGDIRILFKNAPQLYAPPVDEVFYFLPEEQKNLAYSVHNKLEKIGCVRNLERAYMTKYMHPKKKGQAFATIYAAEELYFLPESEREQKLTFKFNLRNICKYADYINECTESIRQSILQTTDCYGCKKACGGIQFRFDNKKYSKCPWYAFKFKDLSEWAADNYVKLIELESQALQKVYISAEL